jgi:nucleoside-diphosphate-sugar epimerase
LTAFQGTYNALLCAEYSGARILVASTSEVYGQPLEHPQTEELWSHINPVGARSCYDTGKAAAESLAANFCAQRGLQVRIARIHNTYGPYMDPHDGRMIPNFICQALQGELLTVYGDGSQTRSLCYVDDMVEGLVELLENESLANGMPVNIGNPDERTVMEIAEYVRAASPPVDPEYVRAASPPVDLDPPWVVYEDLPEDDPTRRCPDVSFMNRLTGWKPRVDLAEGIKRTVEYFEDIMEDDDADDDDEDDE